MVKLFPKVIGLQAEDKGEGHNHVTVRHVTNTTQPNAPLEPMPVSKPAAISFQAEFGLIEPMSVERKEPWLYASEHAVNQVQRRMRSLDSFDMPRQNLWVAPYDFLIAPGQLH